MTHDCFLIIKDFENNHDVFHCSKTGQKVVEQAQIESVVVDWMNDMMASWLTFTTGGNQQLQGTWLLALAQQLGGCNKEV